MSLDQTVSVTCPRCQSSLLIRTYQSMNPGRHADLKAQILDDTLQTVRCTCGHIVREEPDMAYVDSKNELFLRALPSSKMPDYKKYADETEASFTQTLTQLSPGPKSQRRLVFGWPAFREKILAQESGISDVDLEMLKMAVIRQAGEQIPFQTTSLRLVEVKDQALIFNCVAHKPPHEIKASFEYGRELLETMKTHPDDWKDLREAIDQGVFIDLYAQLY